MLRLHRTLEARVEALVTQALGTRAKAVRAFRQQLDGAPDLAQAGSPAGATLEVFMAAQVSGQLSTRDMLVMSVSCCCQRYYSCAGTFVSL